VRAKISIFERVNNLVNISVILLININGIEEAKN